jgi:hypothetical protein
MSGKLRITYAIKGDRKSILMMVNKGSTFGDFLETVRRRNPGLAVSHVWLDGSGIDLVEVIDDYYEPDAIFILTTSGDAVEPAVAQYFYAARGGGRLGSTFSATAPAAAAPALPAAAFVTAPGAKAPDLTAAYADQPHMQITGKALADDNDAYI